MSHSNKIILAGGLVFALVMGGFLILSRSSYLTIFDNADSPAVSKILGAANTKKLANPPYPLKGIYISAWTASASPRVNELIKLIDSTELNAVVVDVKDASGYFSYKVDVPLAQKSGANDKLKIRNIDSFINQFHQKGIYVIGRVQVFQDPVLAQARPDAAIKDSQTGQLWQDKKGLAWLDPSSRMVWQYAADIGWDMARHGFDEVNYDYVRFPSDGVIERLDFPFWDAVKPKYELIGEFFSFLDQELQKADIKTSADIFGLAAWRAMDFSFDLNIGQRMVDALPYFDYVSPMVYPSHYPDNFNGIKKPAAKPYEIVLGSLKTWQDLKATTSSRALLRPWLQDFTLGGITYDKTRVRAQIQATYDAGVESWLLWNSSNVYTRGALLDE